MSRLLHIDPAGSVPIWRQIEEGLQRLVASGVLGAGSPVPSVRDLAKELKVNPATVAKAYQRLCDAGVFCVKRGEGTFVTEAPPVRKRSERVRMLKEAAAKYAVVVTTIGATVEDAVDELRAAIDELGTKHVI